MPKVYPLTVCSRGDSQTCWDKSHKLITWTLHEDIHSTPMTPPIKPAQTLVDEIEQSVETWYVGLGQTVPESDKEYIHVWREEENKEATRWEKIIKGEIIEPITPPKPLYGTPEFWKAYWQKKKGLTATDATSGSRPAIIEKKKKNIKVTK